MSWQGFGAPAQQPQTVFGGGGGFGQQAAFQPASGFSTTASAPAAVSTKNARQNGDIEIPNSPVDGISALVCNGSPAQPTNMLIATAWDGTVACYEVSWSAQNTLSNVALKTSHKHDRPVLCAGIAADNVTVFSGGADNQLKMWNPTATGAQASVVGVHDAPIRDCKVLSERGIVVTSSWDRRVRIWDCRQQAPAAEAVLDERVYVMDATAQALVAGTATNNIHVFDITAGLSKKMAQYNPGLNHQFRGLSIFTDRTGYAVGSIEGRVAIQYFDEMAAQQKMPNQKGFIFKCHRIKKSKVATDSSCDIYGVNGISFTQRNTFGTCGSDGNIIIWDKDSKQRTATLDRFEKENTISALTFNPMNNLLFYALSYDWSFGFNHPNRTKKHSIYVHMVSPDEISPKPAAMGRK